VSIPAILFVLMAIGAVVLLLVVSKPPGTRFRTPQEAFERIARPRHFARLRQIEQALRPQDFRYLQARGLNSAARQLQVRRRRVALNYINELQEEFETLLEASRFLAVSAPNVVAMQEFERWNLSLTFAMTCAYLRTKLRMGIEPFVGLGRLSGLSADVSRRIESATKLILERAVADTGLGPTEHDSSVRGG
jgi:hypothetical protein